MRRLSHLILAAAAALGTTTAMASEKEKGTVVELPALAPSQHSVVNQKSVSTTFPESGYPWKRNIVATVFWVGEKPAKNNPVPNDKSSWDVRWMENFGGYDNPSSRCHNSGYKPASFTPQQNPFYVALPYNDVGRGGTKPEAALVIPWFRTAFEKNGKSVCKGRWVAVRKGRRVAYGQWEDVGPFRTDHWQYVFGNERPKSNINKGAGIDLSPAIRDYLGMEGGMDTVDWKFVEFYEVPPGPWRRYGDNNIFTTHPSISDRISRGRTLQ
jgi:hypothetical protein